MISNAQRYKHSRLLVRNFIKCSPLIKFIDVESPLMLFGNFDLKRRLEVPIHRETSLLVELTVCDAF